MIGDSTIADVSYTLLKLLRDKFYDLLAPNSITLQSPIEGPSLDNGLTLFLYNTKENSYLKKQVISHIGMGLVQSPPLVLDLYYMLTAYSNHEDFTERALAEQRILGRAMRVLHEVPIISGPLLQRSLANTNEKLQITLNPASLTQLTEVWRLFSNQHYRPSVTYLVTPATLQSKRAGG